MRIFLLAFSLFFLGFPAFSPLWAKDLAKVSATAVGDDLLTISYKGEKPSINRFSLNSSKAGQKRLVVDLTGLELTGGKIEQKILGGQVTLRASQFSTTPMQVRVVFEGEASLLDTLNIDTSNAGLAKLSFKPPAKPIATPKPSEKKATPKPLSKKPEEQPKKPEEVKVSPSPSPVANPQTSAAQPEQPPLWSPKPGTKTSQVASSDQKKVLVSFENGEAKRLVIKSPDGQELKFKYFELEAPNRLVVDLFTEKALLSETVELHDIDLKKNDYLLGVRSGVPDSKEKCFRLVFDLARKDLSFSEQLKSDKSEIFIFFNQLKERLADKALPQSGPKDFKVMIDPGHGGIDSGASYGGFDEKALTLQIAKQLAQSLKEKGIAVILTREDDSFVSLEQRVALTLKHNPTAFVSIHLNALQSLPEIAGLETYYYTAQSYPLAEEMHKSLVTNAKLTDRNIRKAKFVVIRETMTPSVLLELGFMTNEAERKKLASTEYQRKLVSALSRGLLKYAQAQKPSSVAAKQ